MMQIHLVKSKKVKIPQKYRSTPCSWTALPPRGDLGRAYLQGGSQEFGGEGGERLRNGLGMILLVFLGFGTVLEEILSKSPFKVPSQKVFDSKIKQNAKIHADSSGQIPKSQNLTQNPNALSPCRNFRRCFWRGQNLALQVFSSLWRGQGFTP